MMGMPYGRNIKVPYEFPNAHIRAVLERKHLTSGHFQQPLNQCFCKEEWNCILSPITIRRKNFFNGLFSKKPGQCAAKIRRIKMEGSKMELYFKPDYHQA